MLDLGAQRPKFRRYKLVKKGFNGLSAQKEPQKGILEHLGVSFTVRVDDHLQKLPILRNGRQSEVLAWDTHRLGVLNCRDYLVIEIVFTEGLPWTGHCFGTS